MPRRTPLAIRRPRVAAALNWGERSLAALALVIFLPLLLLIAAAIRISSPGPATYAQVRVGHYGRRFRIYKFRTMRRDAEAQFEAVLAQFEVDRGAFLKVKDDPRVTRLGRVLRKTSLDELPQLINVVRGDMSLVGPRPQTPLEVSTYDDLAWRRLLVRPGITGLWQVSGRSDLAPDEGLALDTAYVQQWSPMLDVRLLARTASVVLGQRGAY